MRFFGIQGYAVLPWAAEFHSQRDTLGRVARVYLQLRLSCSFELELSRWGDKAAKPLMIDTTATSTTGYRSGQDTRRTGAIGVSSSRIRHEMVSRCAVWDQRSACGPGLGEGPPALGLNETWLAYNVVLIGGCPPGQGISGFVEVGNRIARGGALSGMPGWDRRRLPSTRRLGGVGCWGTHSAPGRARCSGYSGVGRYRPGSSTDDGWSDDQLYAPLLERTASFSSWTSAHRRSPSPGILRHDTSARLPARLAQTPSGCVAGRGCRGSAAAACALITDGERWNPSQPGAPDPLETDGGVTGTGWISRFSVAAPLHGQKVISRGRDVYRAGYLPNLGSTPTAVTLTRAVGPVGPIRRPMREDAEQPGRYGPPRLGVGARGRPRRQVYLPRRTAPTRLVARSRAVAATVSSDFDASARRPSRKPVGAGRQGCEHGRGAGLLAGAAWTRPHRQRGRERLLPRCNRPAGGRERL